MIPRRGTATQPPAYDELPVDARGIRRAWGVFGPDDNVGLCNLFTPERILSASHLIRRGAVFALNAPLDGFDPPPAESRGTPRHTVIRRAVGGTTVFDDVFDNFYPQ